MAIYALLGGRSISYLKTPILEEKIFMIANIVKPNILFFPFACIEDMDKSYNKFKVLMESYECQLDCLFDLSNEEIVNSKIKWADVLYFGGGHSDDLISTVKNSCLEEILTNIKFSNKLICGISAGAIMMAKSGMGDRFAYSNAYNMYNYKMVNGLNLLPITICPHYDHDGLWCYNDVVSKYDTDGYALEDDTAIVIMDNGIFPIKADNSKSIYYFSKKDNYVVIPLYEVE